MVPAPTADEDVPGKDPPLETETGKKPEVGDGASNPGEAVEAAVDGEGVTRSESALVTESDQPDMSSAPGRGSIVEESHPRVASVPDGKHEANDVKTRKAVSAASQSSTAETAASRSTRATVVHAAQQRPISVGKRMCVTTGWTIFGLLFFYVVMVGLSTLTNNIVLNRIPHHGWARTASRQTASVSTVVFAIFMVSDKSKMFSLISAVLLACAQFCHFVIVWSDVRAYDDEEVLVQITRKERTHTLLGMLPLKAMPVLGSAGFIACLVIVNERVYGSALRHRKPDLPFVSRVCVGWLVGLYALYYLDNLIWVIRKESYKVNNVLYPLLFLLMLFVGATYRLAETASKRSEITATETLAAKKNQ